MNARKNEGYINALTLKMNSSQQNHCLWTYIAIVRHSSFIDLDWTSLTQIVFVATGRQ
jgi:hypothetical protein